MILSVNKPLGLTSYDIIRNLKKKYPGEKIGHAGTLDPLAEGVLIVLIGDDTKRQSEFMNVSKVYEFDVLFGFETDTYDVLGLVNGSNDYNADEILKLVESNLPKGKVIQKVPPFSAVKVKGKPLYRWYLNGQIDKVEVPSREVDVKLVEVLDSRIVGQSELESEINNLLDKVRSGFRQDKVRDSWKQTFQKSSQDKFLIVKIRAEVSKGTYVRAIAHDIGQKLGIGACTVTIKRTSVGEYSLDP